MIDKDLVDKFFFEIKDNKFVENLDPLGYQIFDKKLRELAYRFVLLTYESNLFTRTTEILCGYLYKDFYNNNKFPDVSQIRCVHFGNSSKYGIDRKFEETYESFPLGRFIYFIFESVNPEKNFFGFTTGKIKKDFRFYPFNTSSYLDEEVYDDDLRKNVIQNRHEDFRKAINNELANLNKSDSDLFNKFLAEAFSLLDEVRIETEIERSKLLKGLEESITFIDKDNDGKVDLIEDTSFNELLLKYQQYISEVDIAYMQKFVKISLYLKTKRENIQKIFNSIKKSKDIKESNELLHLLKNQIHIYELLVFHSISMLISLVKKDFISFFEIYEKFDQLDIFNSKWERDISKKLTKINKNLRELMYTLNQMESSIVKSLKNLSYVNQTSFLELKDTISTELTSINSTIKFNNLLTGIQAYQLYKINKNTKSIKE